MPVYQDEEHSLADLKKIMKTHVCAECGRSLAMFVGDDLKKFVACNRYLIEKALGNDHSQVAKLAFNSRKQELGILSDERIKDIMTEHGTSTALTKYMGGVSHMTREIASEIIETLWKDAPLAEKTKAIILCETDQLNPLLKPVYLVPYNRKKNGEIIGTDWSMQLGIGATRLLARRKHDYSYVDFSPRKATQAEVDKILGDTQEKGMIYAICIIKDMRSGGEFFGLRGISKDATIQGSEKGNTHLNMASVRAERQALDRAYPGELPAMEIEAFDDRFVEAEYRVVEEEPIADTKHLSSEPADNSSISEPDPVNHDEIQSQHWCPLHNCEFVKRKGRGGAVFYSHKTDDGWCNEADVLNDIKKKDAEASHASQSVSESSEEEHVPDFMKDDDTKKKEEHDEPPVKPERKADTVKTINDLYKACNADFQMQPADVHLALGIKGRDEIFESPWSCYQKVSATRS